VRKKELTQEQLNEYRQLHLVASVLLPMLEQKKEMAYRRLVGDFRNTKSANLALVAECSAYSSIMDDINAKLKNYERLTKEKE